MQKLIIIFIIVSFVFYIYYKIKHVRSKLPMTKKYVGGKSRMMLGFFVLFFGINTLFINDKFVSYMIAGLFIIVGAISIYDGFRHYRFFLPYAIEEFEADKNQN